MKCEIPHDSARNAVGLPATTVTTVDGHHSLGCFIDNFRA